jgi:hypothetical protein
MAEDAAELESLATALSDLTDRIVAVADRYAGARDEGVATDLYDAERNLRMAHRKLAHVVRGLG